MVDYLQRWFGYGLTGSVRDEKLAFWIGAGGNGKTKIAEAISWCMGDYAKPTMMETLLASNHERHPTEIADLQGARLVTAVESNVGRRWDEGKIKLLTGSDKLKARFMKQDFFEFDPTFKLLVYSNHKPRIRMADEAMRRRLDLVQFDVVIPEKERDQLLSEKLRKEGPGILDWAIRGCIEWQRVGLKSPQRVRDATDAYLRSQDLFNSWMEENCETGANRRENRTSLFSFLCVLLQGTGR
jgi:putative DNA primase/helicase